MIVMLIHVRIVPHVMTKLMGMLATALLDTLEFTVKQVIFIQRKPHLLKFK